MTGSVREAITIEEMNDILVSGKTLVNLNLKLKVPSDQSGGGGREGGKLIDVPLKIPLEFDLDTDDNGLKKIKVQTPQSAVPVGSQVHKMKTKEADEEEENEGKEEEEENGEENGENYKSEDVNQDLCSINMNEELTLKLRLPIKIADESGRPIGKRRYVSVPFKINAKSTIAEWEDRRKNEEKDSKKQSLPSFLGEKREEIGKNDPSKRNRSPVCCGL